MQIDSPNPIPPLIWPPPQAPPSGKRREVACSPSTNSCYDTPRSPLCDTEGFAAAARSYFALSVEEAVGERSCPPGAAVVGLVSSGGHGVDGAAGHALFFSSPSHPRVVEVGCGNSGCGEELMRHSAVGTDVTCINLCLNNLQLIFTWE
nr:uncharacterized protein LOC109786188 [Aegilops tauschii subsp. strangulata]